MIINERPPNFELIHAHFPDAHKPGVIFAYNGDIYNSSGAPISDALTEHENVHLGRQVDEGADRWWHRYILDSGFRYQEELLAHAAEFKIQRSSGDRNVGAALLMRTALRLVAPLYNYKPPRSLQEAIKDLRQEVTR